MTRHEVMFWICLGLTAFNMFCAIVTDSVAVLREVTTIFLLSAVLSAVGMVANIINIKQMESEGKKKR